MYKLKIGLDVSPLANGHKVRGVGNYVKHLRDGLLDNSKIDLIEFIDIVPSDVDIVHYPFFSLKERTLPFRNKKPTVVTIHDVIPLIYPKEYPFGMKAKLNLFFQKKTLSWVDSVIVNSNCTKDDVNKYLNYPKEKIHITSLGFDSRYKKISDKNLLSNVNNKYKLPKTFALYVGDVNWNKNLSNMAEACIKADIPLVLVGKGFENKTTLNHPEQLPYKIFLEKYGNNPKILILGYIEDSELVAIYNLASVFLLVSFYEGFGLPILEAQSCGVPVITSKVSSLPEVAGQGALFVDPKDITEIEKKITEVLNNSILREKLVEQGNANLKRFSWNKCIQETIKVYETITNP